MPRYCAIGTFDRDIAADTAPLHPCGELLAFTRTSRRHGHLKEPPPCDPEEFMVGVSCRQFIACAWFFASIAQAQGAVPPNPLHDRNLTIQQQEGGDKLHLIGRRDTPQCRPGNVWNGRRCIPQCRPGHVWGGEGCVPGCRPGHVRRGDGCVPQCRPGHTWSGTGCVPQCRRHRIWDGQRCVPGHHR